ncbi:hypothetical protein M422DRAFT_36379, partial [Sphaerobolus stellatus SS14]
MMSQTFLRSDQLQDYDGPTGDAAAGWEYFRRHSERLSTKPNQVSEREVYTQSEIFFHCGRGIETNYVTQFCKGDRYSPLRVVMPTV